MALEQLSAPLQWVVIIGVACATYLTYRDIISQVTDSRFWRLFLIPFWFMFYFGFIGYFLLPIGMLLLDFEFTQVAILLAATFALVVVPAPINYGIIGSLIGPKRAVLAIPFWLFAGWAILLTIILPVLAIFWGGHELTSGD